MHVIWNNSNEHGLLLYLRVTQIPRSPDLAIFVLTTTGKTEYFTPCACMWGKNLETDHYMLCMLQAIMSGSICV